MRQYALDYRIARTTIIKVIRGIVITDMMSFRVPTEEFSKRDFGMTRLDAVQKLFDEFLGIKVEGIATMQVIPLGDVCEVRLRSE
jgi:hypothetical protein